ncbi:hypothetical protein DSECCO2_321420 [anaerobic digester metagenome]
MISFPVTTTRSFQGHPGATTTRKFGFSGTGSTFQRIRERITTGLTVPLPASYVNAKATGITPSAREGTE